MRKYFTLFFILLSLLFSLDAQEPYRCGLDTYLEQTILSNPTLKSDYIKYLQDIASNRISNPDTLRANSDTIYTVQVVVHVVYLNDNKYENIPDDIIQSQIDALNRDYNLLNDDTVNLRPFFKPFQGKAKIKFELAKKTPGGQVTTGITRTKGVKRKTRK